jgi:hypothetical protein
MYFTWTMTGVAQVWKVNAPDHFPEQITGMPDANQIWGTTPDGESLIVLRKAPGRNEKTGITLLSKSGGAEIKVLSDANCDLKPIWVTNDNSKLFYLCFDQGADKTSIYSYAIESSQNVAGAHDIKRELFFSQAGHWNVVDVLKEQFLLEHVMSPRESEYFSWSISDKSLVPIPGLSAVRVREIMYTLVSGEYTLLTEGAQQLFVLRGGERQAIALNLPAGAEIRRFHFDLRRADIYLELNTANGEQFEIFDLKSLQQIILPELAPLSSIRVAQISRYGRFVLLNAKTPTSSFIQVVYDWRDKKLIQWLPAVSFAVAPLR